MPFTTASVLFQRYERSVDGVIIEGSRAFVLGVKEELNLMKSRAPEWYAYVIKGPRKIREQYWAPISPGQAGTSLCIRDRSICIPTTWLYPLFTTGPLAYLSP